MINKLSFYCKYDTRESFLGLKTHDNHKYVLSEIKDLSMFQQDYRTKKFPLMDHNVVPVYDMGYSGATITVAVIGDGVMEHPDLVSNYVSLDS